MQTNTAITTTSPMYRHMRPKAEQLKMSCGPRPLYMLLFHNERIIEIKSKYLQTFKESLITN